MNASEEVVRSAGKTGLAPAIYEETQLFPMLLYAFLFGFTAIEGVVITSVFLNANASVPGNMLAMGGVFALLCFLINLLVLRTRVEGTELHVSLGWIPIFWSRIALTEVEQARVVTYRPMRDAGGWGMRFGRFEGESCRFWNARGDDGVLLVTAQRRCIIGSQRPNELLAAIREAGGGQPNGSRTH